MHAAPAGAEPFEKRGNFAARHGLRAAASDIVQKIVRGADLIGRFPPFFSLHTLPLVREGNAGEQREEFRARNALFRLVGAVRIAVDLCAEIIDLLICPMRVGYVGVVRRADCRAEQQRRKDQKQDVTYFHVKLPSLSVPPDAAALLHRQALFR